MKTTVTASDERLHVLAVVEIPLAELVIAFNRHFSDIDLIEEIRKGRIEELENDFRKAMFERLSAGLELLVDGRPGPAWHPSDAPINGRAGEGFFVYMLEASLERAAGPARLELSNSLYPEQPMVLANLALAQLPWRVVESSTPQPDPGADLTEGSLEELALWSDEPEKRHFQLRLDRARE